MDIVMQRALVNDVYTPEPTQEYPQVDRSMVSFKDASSPSLGEVKLTIPHSLLKPEQLTQLALSLQPFKLTASVTGRVYKGAQKLTVDSLNIERLK